MIDINGVTWAFIGLFAVAGIIILIIARKDNRIRQLEKDKKSLINALNYSAKIVGESNILGVPPKELPKEFDED
jgi:hypothetical protein